MKPGTKRMSPEEKQARGTYQACRDGPQHLVVVAAAPVMPGYLSEAAQVVWREEVDRVVQTGFGELDSSFFSSYCALEAHIRAEIAAGRCPSTNMLVEERRRQEVLGIAGPSSRALRGTPSKTEPGNPWAQLGA